MKTKKTNRPPPAAKKAPAPRPPEKYHLRLYVAGASERSRQAILRARRLCDTEFNGDYELEVIDIYQQPILARDGQILATPTLVREFPNPVRRFLGNLTHTDALFVGLDYNTKGKSA